jgi:hypothetical protein
VPALVEALPGIREERFEAAGRLDQAFKLIDVAARGKKCEKTEVISA